MFKIFQYKFIYKMCYRLHWILPPTASGWRGKGDAATSAAWQSNKQNSTGSFTLWVQGDEEASSGWRQKGDARSEAGMTKCNRLST